jgi:hypothetical protein
LEARDGPGLRVLEPLLGGWDPSGWVAEPPRRADREEGPQQLPLFL